MRRHLEDRLGPLDEFAIDGEVRPFATMGASVTARLASWLSRLSSASAPVPASRIAEIGFDATLLATIYKGGEDGATRDELLRCELRPSAGRRDASLKRLNDAGWIVETTTPGRGRPSTRYIIVPDEDELMARACGGARAERGV